MMKPEGDRYPKRHLAIRAVLVVAIIAILFCIPLSGRMLPPIPNPSTRVTDQWADTTIGRRADWSTEPTPAFCHALLTNPQPYKKGCTLSYPSLTCSNFEGENRMFSQYHQDYYLFTRHFKNLQRRGVYVDIATNEAIRISNTFFFDRCLQWKGVCVEANPQYFEKIYRLRSCTLVPTCVGAADGEVVQFKLNGGLGGVIGDTYKGARKTEGSNTTMNVIQRRCTTMSLALKRENVQYVDYMSLDVEGHELPVLMGFDFERVQINIMTIETTKESLKEITDFLRPKGYVRHFADLPGTSGPTGLLREDAVFLHKSVKFGSPV